jgi:hypothetical protein
MTIQIKATLLEHYFQCSGNVANTNPLVMPPQSQVETQSSQASSFDTNRKLSMIRKRSNPNVILVCPSGLPMFFF